MGELTLTAVRLGLLVLLWLFVFSIVGVIRGDLYGTRIVRRGPSGRATVRPTSNVPSGVERRASHGLRSLVVVEGPLRGTSVPLRASGVLLGRNPECTLVLDDDFASGRHARVYEEGGQWFVEDLGSTNGTFIAGERLVDPVPVRDSSQLRIGTTVLELRR
ncbi:FHA domain-containing protein FhaB [Austwickia sp. TVS 96-490-7B]|uniref:FHA domain-containing protein FhaB/FipA n=1 Tax=Austwickia sp. TVS 96-490-7B TaxID=2830843 RepID=UPI001C569007|nr:FHA domain-containing protein [Austwickia sp. TVS 96-490-7B]MBW3084224.1 FHA domain-containing protein FhaB [Austwickia sp. TVS 96-490-7B]